MKQKLNTSCHSLIGHAWAADVSTAAPALSRGGGREQGMGRLRWRGCLPRRPACSLTLTTLIVEGSISRVTSPHPSSILHQSFYLCSNDHEWY